jgi:hypothetical protein
MDFNPQEFNQDGQQLYGGGEDWNQDEQGPQEVVANAQQPVNIQNAPLMIPGPFTLSKAYRWNLEAGPPGAANAAFEPLIATVTARIQNFVGQGPVDNNPGRLIRNCYDNAFLLARRRFNLRGPAIEDEEWLQDHPTATKMAYTTATRIHVNYTNVPWMYERDQYEVFGGEQEPAVVNFNQQNRRPFSMVKVTIENMPVIRGDELGIVDSNLSSDNVYIRPNDPSYTVRRLYTSLAMRYFHNNNEDFQVGSSPQLVFPANIDARRNAIRITFQFMFVKQDNWVPLEDPNDFVPSIQTGNIANASVRILPQRDAAIRSGLANARRVVEAPANQVGQAVNEVLGSLYVGGRRFSARASSAGGARRTAGANTTESLYFKLKERIYIKRTLGDFFTHSKACIGVPVTEEELCFPMSFMRCQLRTWTHQVVSGHILSDMLSVQEDEVFNLKLNEDAVCPYDLKTSFFDGENIRVFDCTKVQLPRVGRNGKTMYKNESIDLSPEEINLWKWCAYQVHYFVEGVCKTEIPMQDLDLCLQAYSFAFQVNISVYAMEMKGERIIIETLPTCKREKESFIGLILQNTHLHAISSVRHYHRSEVNPLGTSLHTYCDFCNTMCYSRTRDFTHVNKCCQNDDWKVCQSLEDLHANEATKMETRKKYQYLKADKRSRLICLSCFKSKEDDCFCLGDTQTKMTTFVTCKVCNKMAGLYYFNQHRCFMSPRKPKKVLDNQKIFVYDIESMQTYNPDINQYVHECILICLRAVYDDRKWKFDNIPDYVRFLIDNKEMHGSVILAHNGGGYDHQFVLRYLEDSGIMHTTTPRPNTLHKYLMVEITMKGDESSIKFLDFMMMMTDSLRNIGKAFKLDICKGDFPHKFSKAEHLEYNGPLPPSDHPDDYYNFKEMKSQLELDESREYWKKQELIYCTCYDGMCICNKKKWNFKKELEAYCWIDVDVLAGACKAYRDQALNFSGNSDYAWSTNGIEPFQYMTQSQIALALFMQGKEQNNIAITHEKIRPSFDPNQILWMENFMDENPQYDIQHAGNSFQEYFDIETNTFVDGYCKKNRTVFEYLNCFTDGCCVCYENEIRLGAIHPTRNVKWDKVSAETYKRLNTLRVSNNYLNVITRWSHDKETYIQFKEIPTLGNIMKLRDFFYGGRTEVFAAYADASKLGDMEILHHDVCSLYPYVCSWKELPVGVPEIKFHKNVERERLNPNHPDKYFGFARIKVRPNSKDLIGILPSRQKAENGDEKLTYDLFVKEGCWHTELIYLAMEHQYEILEIYEVWHWPLMQRSTTLMRGYMEFFLRMKQEAEGWEKLGKDILNGKQEADIEDKDKKDIAEMIFNNNGGFARPRIEKVEKNPVLRQLAKIFLNCLWGKLCQKNASEYERFIYGYKQYLEICSNSMINLSTIKFRHVNGCVFKARYELTDNLQETNRFLNIPIAASVTAHAQVVLMRQMFKIGPERVLYCDTDSIMFIREKALEKLNKSGLGNWEDEHPNEVIKRFWALAPKCYMMEIDSDNTIDYHFKCKGVRSTEDNRKNTSYDKIHDLIEREFLEKESGSINAATMIIHPNSTNSMIPYGTLCTSYGTKKIQIVFSKRELLVNKDENVKQLSDKAIVRLVPFGYNGNVVNEL